MLSIIKLQRRGASLVKPRGYNEYLLDIISQFYWFTVIAEFHTSKFPNGRPETSDRTIADKQLPILHC
jgi:hypothetical protein